MSATARKHDVPEPEDHAAAESTQPVGSEHATEYATRGARGHRAARPNLRIVSPLRPERASRGMFALIVGAILVVGMVGILVINTTLAQGAFTVSELQARQAELSQQAQALSEDVDAAAAPKALEKEARSLGMVPSENPVFIEVPSGQVLGKPKPAGGASVSLPRLLTPADATVSEAVDNGAADLPQSVPVGYDPAAADAAVQQAQANEASSDGARAAAAGEGSTAAATDATAGTADGKAGKVGKAGKTDAKAGKKSGANGENRLWEDSTVIDVTGKVGTSDAGLSAVPVD